jgi:cell division protein ZapE
VLQPRKQVRTEELMSLSKQYQLALQQPDRIADQSQQAAVQLLDKLITELNQQRNSRFDQFARKLALHFLIPPPVKGLYLWGGVGRGKTWLMNMFFSELPFPEKARTHFHHFMLDIHAKLDMLNKNAGRKVKNPLHVIAHEIASQYRVLCIDEFIVTNITDAMILSTLLQALFDRGVCIVATSNRVPDNLYLNGLQRERFLPAIELIKQHMTVFNLDNGVDHRMALMEQAGLFYQPIGETTNHEIYQRVQELTVTPLEQGRVLIIQNRPVRTVHCSEDIAWFDFNVICSEPRATPDYIEIAERFATIVITGIPVLNEQDDQARRFIYLIDELYDRNVKLIASAAASPDQLYRGSMLEFAFNRTRSRLIEMQTHHYLLKTHHQHTSM